MNIPWLDRLLEEAKGTDLKADPLEENEDVIGTIPDHLLPIFKVTSFVSINLDRLLKNHRVSCRGDESCELFFKEFSALKRKFDVLEALSWISLREEMGIPEELIGVRSGNLVVKLQKQNENPNLPHLSTLVAILDG